MAVGTILKYIGASLVGILLGLSSAWGYATRRWLLASWFRLPPPEYEVGVTRKVPIPMRDGVVLWADHYFPKGDGPFPTILMRSGYGRGKEAGLIGWMSSTMATPFVERGYHLLIQTTRGRFDSGGVFHPFFDATADGQDTLAWIAQQPWFDGNLGMWGQSWLGYVQWAVAAEAPPFLKALVPDIITSSHYRLFYPDGILALETLLRWATIITALEGDGVTWKSMQRISPATLAKRLAPATRHLPLQEADVLAAEKPVRFYREWLAHPDPHDPFWAESDHSTSLAQVKVPVQMHTGWYDFLLRDQLADYQALVAAGQTPYLTIGPWSHQDMRLILESLRNSLAWFDAHLKGDSRQLRRQPVRLYVMGANAWREMAQWPPLAQEVRYFLHPREELGLTLPDEKASPDRYLYDPNDPTPSLGGPLFSEQAGPCDNRPLEVRPDVLVYTSAPLRTALEVIGPVRLTLYVSSTVPHTDFFARLCDVHPDGRSINICDGIFRVKPGTPEPQEDGSLCIEVDMWATAHRFLAGHALRLLVSSGAHPRWNRNLGTGDPLATATEMVVAEQTIYHDPLHPSALILPVPKE